MMMIIRISYILACLENILGIVFDDSSCMQIVTSGLHAAQLLSCLL
jgi:hypothetical protein